MIFKNENGPVPNAISFGKTPSTESVNTVFNKYTAGIIKQQTTIMKQMRIYHYTTRAMCYKTVVFFLDN